MIIYDYRGWKYLVNDGMMGICSFTNKIIVHLLIYQCSWKMIREVNLKVLHC
jgi:hypothetical protein